MNIWDLWYREAALVNKDGNPTWDAGVSVYLISEPDLSDDAVLEAVKNCLGESTGELTIQRDYFINVLYYAAVRAQTDITLYALETEPITVDFDTLQALIPAINQLSAILAFKTNTISAERFAQELRDETVYFTTPMGDDEEGNHKLYLLSAKDSDTLLFPVFLTEAHMHAFFQQERRPAYAVLQNTLKDFLSLLDTTDKLSELGVVIEPLLTCHVALPPLLRIK